LETQKTELQQGTVTAFLSVECSFNSGLKYPKFGCFHRDLNSTTWIHHKVQHQLLTSDHRSFY